MMQNLKDLLVYLIKEELKMRDDIYAEYNGKEYKTGEKNNGLLFLVSNDPKDVNIGFTPLDRDSSKFIKYVTRDELGDMYLVRTYARYKGVAYLVIAEIDDKIEVCDCIDGGQKADYSIMTRAGKIESRMWLNKPDVELYEKKTEL